MGSLPRKRPVVLGPVRNPPPGDWGGAEPSPNARREHELRGDWIPVDVSNWSGDPPTTPCPGPLVYHVGAFCYECYGTCSAITDGHAQGEGVTVCIENGAIEELEQRFGDPIQRCPACESADRPATARDWLAG